MKSKILLVIIISIAIIVRFVGLGSNPPSPTWDEVSWGYNAYTLDKDGRDEFGRFLPIDYLESFGDFKPPLYAYLTVIPVKIFGLTVFATRFASASFGVLGVFLTYFLVKEVFRKREEIKNKELEKTQEGDMFKGEQSIDMLALLSAFFLAISPWHIMLSRAAFEANVATTLIIAGVFFFLLSIRKNSWFLLLSCVFFVLSIYTFNSARIVAPLLLLFLSFIFSKQLWQKKKQTICAYALAILLVIPSVPFLLSPQASLRFKEVNIFSNVDIIKNSNQQIANDYNAWYSKILHNRRLMYSVEFLHHYFDHFNSTFLFIQGDGNPKFSIQDVGQMYLWDLPFFIIGLLFLFRKKEGYWWILPVWLLLAIIPAATARETPHALRIENSLPVWQILTAYGVFFLLTNVVRIRYNLLRIPLRYIVIFLICSGLFLNSSYFFYNYIRHYSREYAREWQYGYIDAFTYAGKVEKKYKKIFITREFGRPYAYYLFAQKIDPQKFRNNAKIEREVLGFVHIDQVGKYYFVLETRGLTLTEKVLYIDTPEKIPAKAKKLKTFYYPDGTEALIAFEK